LVFLILAALRVERIRAQQAPTDPAWTPQITGTPGSPNATTTINGEQLPPPQPFGGKMEPSLEQSKSYWPMKVVPPQGRAKRTAHHDRRCRLRHLQHIRRVIPSLSDPDRQGCNR
jgi:hypothetical protein